VIHAVSIARIRATGAPIVVDEIVAPTSSIEAVSVSFNTGTAMVAQGNIRVPRIKSAATLKLLIARAAKLKGGTLAGGYLGYPGEPKATRVRVPEMPR
jgi:hypothetical protein